MYVEVEVDEIISNEVLIIFEILLEVYSVELLDSVFLSFNESVLIVLYCNE